MSLLDRQPLPQGKLTSRWGLYLMNQVGVSVPQTTSHHPCWRPRCSFRTSWCSQHRLPGHCSRPKEPCWARPPPPWASLRLMPNSLGSGWYRGHLLPSQWDMTRGRWAPELPVQWLQPHHDCTTAQLCPAPAHPRSSPSLSRECPKPSVPNSLRQGCQRIHAHTGRRTWWPGGPTTPLVPLGVG